MSQAARNAVPLVVLAILLLIASPSASHAASALESATAATAGHTASGGGLTLGFTIGQALVGIATPADGTLAESAGFWRWGIPTVLDAGPAPAPATPQLGLAPNPTSAGVAIRLTLPGTPSRETRVAILDVGGRLVGEVVHGRLAPGAHLLEWNGLDRHGAPAAPGLYFCRVTTVGFTLNRRFAIIR